MNSAVHNMQWLTKIPQIISRNEVPIKKVSAINNMKHLRISNRWVAYSIRKLKEKERQAQMFIVSA